MTVYSDFRPFHFDSEHTAPLPISALKGHHTRSLKVLGLGGRSTEALMNFDLNCVRGRSHSPRSAEQRSKHETLLNVFQPRSGYGADIDLLGGKRLVSPLTDISARRVDDYSPRGLSPQYHDIDHQSSRRMFSEPPPSATPRTPRNDTYNDVHVACLADSIGRAGSKSTLREQAHQRNLRQVWRRSTSPKPLEAPGSPRGQPAASPVQRNRSVSVRRRTSAASPPRGQGSPPRGQGNQGNFVPPTTPTPSPSNVMRLRSTPPQLLGAAIPVTPSPLLGPRSVDRLSLKEPLVDDVSTEGSPGPGDGGSPLNKLTNGQNIMSDGPERRYSTEYPGTAAQGFELSALGQSVKLLRALQNQASPKSTLTRKSIPSATTTKELRHEVNRQVTSETISSIRETGRKEETAQELEFRRTLEKVLNEQLEATWTAISAKLDIQGNRTPGALAPNSTTPKGFAGLQAATTPRPGGEAPPPATFGHESSVPVEEPFNDGSVEAPPKTTEESQEQGVLEATLKVEEESYEQAATGVPRASFSKHVPSPLSTIGTPSTTCETGRTLNTRSCSFESFATMQTITPTNHGSMNGSMNVPQNPPMPMPQQLGFRNTMLQRPVPTGRRPGQQGPQNKSLIPRRAWK